MWLQGGYGHVLAGLGDFITGARSYGTDVERAGRWVAEGSALIGRDDVAPYAVEVLSGIDFSHVVDLGCGNARFLIGAAQRFGVTGVGVDLSPEACEDAERRIAEAELVGKVVVRCGDAGDLDAIPELADADLAVAHFLLHEIFEHGRAALDRLPDEARRLMPRGAHMLVAEVQPASGAHDERWRPEFTLLHAIMRQELLDAEGWHEAFTAAGWSRHEVRELGLPGAILLLYRTTRGDPEPMSVQVAERSGVVVTEGLPVFAGVRRPPCAGADVRHARDDAGRAVQHRRRRRRAADRRAARRPARARRPRRDLPVRDAGLPLHGRARRRRIELTSPASVLIPRRQAPPARRPRGRDRHVPVPRHPAGAVGEGVAACGSRSSAPATSARTCC